MFDLSYSLHNFETIFDIECRKRDMKDYMPKEYSIVVDEIVIYNKELRALKGKRYKSLTETEKNRIVDLEDKIENAHKRKNNIKDDALYNYTKVINSKSFDIALKEIDRAEGVYSLDMDSPELFFLAKKMQYNLRKVFNVKQNDRHLVLSQLKLLLNEDTPRYVIKTDITKFYESIPQDKLLKLLFDNRSLDAKSKSLIKSIIENYELIKDKTVFEAGCGVPRGIGVSAYLSEVYMAELDKYVRNYKGVVYYARYVDDIMIIMQKDADSITINDEYVGFVSKFKEFGLELKKTTDTRKCRLLNLINDSISSELLTPLNFLGYRIDVVRKNKVTSSKFGVSDNKRDRIKHRITKSIEYFNSESKYDIERAKKVLLASLKLLSSNVKLSGSKSRVKAGIYYSNNLLDNVDEIAEFDTILRDELKKLNPYDRVFSSSAQKDIYVDKLKKKILSIVNFKRGFETKRICKINCETRKLIIKIWH